MEDWNALLQYMPDPYIMSGRFKGRIFPPLDHLHSATLYQLVPGAFKAVREDGWLEFMEDVGIERAVLYSTGGLAFGKVITREFAIDVARAWNNWFADTYLKKSPRFQGLALVPLQELPEASFAASCCRRLASKGILAIKNIGRSTLKPASSVAVLESMAALTKDWAWIGLRLMRRSMAWVMRSARWWRLPESYSTVFSRNIPMFASALWKLACLGCKPV
jgi:hypothetical protein